MRQERIDAKERYLNNVAEREALVEDTRNRNIQLAKLNEELQKENES